MCCRVIEISLVDICEVKSSRLIVENSTLSIVTSYNSKLYGGASSSTSFQAIFRCCSSRPPLQGNREQLFTSPRLVEALRESRRSEGGPEDIGEVGTRGDQLFLEG